MPWRDRLRNDPFVQAALAYAVYGIVYFAFAVRALGPTQRVTHFGFVPWWAFYVVGAAFIVVLPWAIVRYRPWAALVIAFGPTAKALWLFWRLGQTHGEGAAFNVVFALVALVAAVLLMRAGWAGRATRR